MSFTALTVEELRRTTEAVEHIARPLAFMALMYLHTHPKVL